MKKLLLITAICLFSIACKKEKNEVFDRKKVLENIAYNIVTPQVNKGLKDARNLLDNCTKLISSPNEKQLEVSKNDWRKVLLQWKEIEILNIGTIKSSYIHSSIARWPCNPNFIDELGESQNLNLNQIKATGAANKGIYAIEYLLYHKDLIEDSKKLKLLQLQTEGLVEALEYVLELWTGSQGYLEEFTNDLSSGLYSPYPSYINSLVSAIDFIYKHRLGKPMGKFNRSNAIDLDKVENPYAEISLESIRKSLKSIHLLYMGGSKLGADDELNFIFNSSKKSNEIESQFIKCIEKSSLLDTSLKVALETQYSDLDELYNELRKLKILLKNELSSALSVTIVLSDTDGD
jgi:predicted lipoprotein